MHEINFILNGAPRRVIVDPQKILLKVIREDLKLTGTKEGCSAGHCGSCAVLMDGEVVLSCKVPMVKAQGKEITTIEAIELAGSYLRGKTKSIELKLTGKGTIGQPVTRPDALEKATGTTLYAADLAVDGCAYIKALRSPHHHAKIVQIDKKETEAIPGVITVLTAEDVKGTNILKMAGDDQPILCGNKG